MRGLRKLVITVVLGLAPACSSLDSVKPDDGSCAAGNEEYGRVISTDPELLRLRSCTRDDECVVYDPGRHPWCTGPSDRICAAFATQAGNVEATQARQVKATIGACVEGVLCPILGTRCPPGAIPRCVAGTCTVVFDAGVDGGVADSGA